MKIKTLLKLASAGLVASAIFACSSGNNLSPAPPQPETYTASLAGGGTLSFTCPVQMNSDTTQQFIATVANIPNASYTISYTPALQSVKDAGGFVVTTQPTPCVLTQADNTCTVKFDAIIAKAGTYTITPAYTYSAGSSTSLKTFNVTVDAKPVPPKDIAQFIVNYNKYNGGDISTASVSYAYLNGVYTLLSGIDSVDGKAADLWSEFGRIGGQPLFMVNDVNNNVAYYSGNGYDWKQSTNPCQSGEYFLALFIDGQENVLATCSLNPDPIYSGNTITSLWNSTNGATWTSIWNSRTDPTRATAIHSLVSTNIFSLNGKLNMVGCIDNSGVCDNHAYQLVGGNFTPLSDWTFPNGANKAVDITTDGAILLATACFTSTDPAGDCMGLNHGYISTDKGSTWHDITGDPVYSFELTIYYMPATKMFYIDSINQSTDAWEVTTSYDGVTWSKAYSETLPQYSIASQSNNYSPTLGYLITGSDNVYAPNQIYSASKDAIGSFTLFPNQIPVSLSDGFEGNVIASY